MIKPESILQKYWGYNSFRYPQDEIIKSVLSGEDVVALLPTGGGKSICYQIPALILKGKTIIISPLIALMQDQVENLFARGIMAKSLNSTMHPKEIDAILDSFVFGDLKMLYISPERIRSDQFISRISKAKVDLIAVDEAHCISHWGYDFRPSYFEIKVLKEVFPKACTIALTATATSKVLDDIITRLDLSKPKVYKKSFERDNLSLISIKTEDKKAELLRILQRVDGSVILYVRNRKETIELSRWLTQCGISATHYHGGMEKKDRDKNQNYWMNNHVRVMVATNAFGMGIDKADVRVVVHLKPPQSLEAYYQEAGRAGRDGKSSYAVMITNKRDLDELFLEFEDSFPSIELVTGVYDRLCRYYKVGYGSGWMESYEYLPQEIADYVQLPPRKLQNILDLLEKEGWITFGDGRYDVSKVLVTADTNDLTYLQQIGDIKYKVLVQLLRKYEGLFLDYVKIDELAISRELQIEANRVPYYLNLLQSDGYILYKPQSANNQIIFTRERPQLENFNIDRKTYQFRKQQSLSKLKAILNYLDSNDCRQSTILSYFDEKSKNCQRCDICLEKSKGDLTNEEKEHILDYLKANIKKRKIDVKSFVHAYPIIKRKSLLAFIHFLQEEEIIDLDFLGHIVSVKESK